MGDSTEQYGILGRWVRSRAIITTDANATNKIMDIPAGTIIPPQSVFIVIVTALSGGTPSVDIGDAGDDNGWIATTAITEGTEATYADVDADLNVAGKYYASADGLYAKVATGLTAGKAYVYAYMLDVSDVHGD